MSDNRILITLELTPDDELVARNAVSGLELDRTGRFDAVLSSRYTLDRELQLTVTVVRNELRALLVEQDDATSERYT